MARIITLGCDVVNIRRRYGEIHDTLFGVSVRRVVDLMKGRERSVSASGAARLADLGGELRVVAATIEDLPPEESTARSAKILRPPLLEYTQALLLAIEALEGICLSLANEGNEAKGGEEGSAEASGYQRSSASGSARFNQDKIHYDYLLRDLEVLGSRLSRLFAGY